jgi:hypothetical protein
VLNEDTPWYLQLLVSLAALVGVAVLVVGVLAVGGVAATHLLGVPTSSTSSHSVIIPTTLPSTPPATGTRPQGSGHSSHRSRSRHTQAITLTASPLQVPAYGQITLSGSYPAPDGTTLQVQRYHAGGGWQDFPITTSVTSANFSTYIRTSHTGANRLRVTDPSTGKTSNVVTVHVG